MKLKRMFAFLIALSMLVGLVFTAPVSALTPVEGYAEEVSVEEYFDKTVGDKLTVFNGNVEDGVLNFELSSKSYVALNEGLDTKNTKQHIIEFDMTTDNAYSDPWTASFIGIRVNKAQLSPEDNEYGAWVGVTTDKVIFWFTHRLTKWGVGEEGVDYLVFDAPTDLSAASYRVIYEGDNVELYANDELIAAFSIVDSYAVLTCGDNSLTSTIKFTDTQTYRFFTINNQVDETEGDDPLTPQDPDSYLPSEDPDEPTEDPDDPTVDPDDPTVDPDDPTVDPDDPTEDPDDPTVDPDDPAVDPDDPEEDDEIIEDPGDDGIDEDIEMQGFDDFEIFEVTEYATVTVDNFMVKAYRELLMTEETAAALEEAKANLELVVETYYSDDEDDDIYLPNSLKISEIEVALDNIIEILEAEEVLEVEAQEVLAGVDGVLSGAVSVDYAAGYPDKFAGFEAVIEDLLADPDSGYSESKLEAVLDMIDSAIEKLEESNITVAALENEITKVAKAISNLGIYTAEGIPTYTQSFTGDYSLAQFETEWYHTGANHKSVTLTSEKGIPINLWGALPGEDGCFRYKMDFRTSYPVYSVQATLSREATGKMMFGIRQTVGADTYEQDYINPVMIGYQGVSIQEAATANNFSTIYVVIKDGTYKASEEHMRVATKIDLTKIPGALSEDKKTFTPLIKDFGELIEIYVVTDEGENVLIAKIVFDAIVTKVTARGTSYDGYSSGTLYNETTGEIIPFTGMCVQLAKNSVIGFSSRSGRYFVKDFKINTNILPAEEVLVYDGSTAPEELAVELSSDTVAVGEEIDFAVNAVFEALKVAGKDEYKAGEIDVKSAPAVTVETTLGDKIVTVDPITGKITGNERGSEIITATYELEDGTKLSHKVLVTVTDDDYEAPTIDDAFDGRVVAAKFANASVFKSVEVGTEIIPVIEYEYPNGETGILPAGSYVEYFSEDEDIVEFDEAKGAYVAKAEGFAKLYAKVYMTLTDEPVETSLIDIEVTAEGEATLGAGATAAAINLIEAADDTTLLTEEKKAILDAAIENAIPVSYEDDLDVELLFAAIASLKGEGLSNDELIAKAYENAKAVRKVFNVIDDQTTTSDDLANLLFGDDAIHKELGLDKKDVSKYEELTNTKAARVMTRLFTQLSKMSTDMTSASIAETFHTIVNSVSSGSGSGKGGVTVTTDKNNGSVGFTPAVTTKPAAAPVKEVITVEQINAAAAKFADADEAAWAKDAIGTLVHKGIISGYEDGTMRPNGVITRDEFVKLLVVAFELETKTDAYNYFWEDVPADGWQVPYIAAAHEANILSGTNGGSFGANVRITREDMASMIYKAVLMKNATLPSDKIVAFTDAENIVDYAKEAVNKLAAAGVISGMGDGTFAPGAGATRAQAFQMIYLILEVM